MKFTKVALVALCALTFSAVDAEACGSGFRSGGGRCAHTSGRVAYGNGPRYGVNLGVHVNAGVSYQRGDSYRRYRNDDGRGFGGQYQGQRSGHTCGRHLGWRR